MLDAYKTTGSSPPCRITLTDVLIMPGCTIALGEGMDQCGRVVCKGEQFYIGPEPVDLLIGRLVDLIFFHQCLMKRAA